MQLEWILILSFGIPYILLVSGWIFVIKKYFYWRPLVFAPYIVANWIRRKIGTKLYWLALFAWWIFFALPILVPVFFSIFIEKKYSNINLTLLIALVPAVIFTLFIIYQNYSHNGFKIGYTTKILLVISFSLIFTLNILTTVYFTGYKWSAYGFFFTIPSLLVYGFCLCYSRRKIMKEAAKKILESDNGKRSFIYDMVHRRFDDWFGGGHKLPWYFIIVFIGFSVVFNFTFYGIYKDKDTLAVSIGSFAIDMLIFGRQYLLQNQFQTVILLFVAFFLKVFVINQGPTFWLYSHSICYLVLGGIFLIRFFWWLYNKSLCPRKKMRLGQSLVDGEIYEQIEKITPEGKRPKSLEAVPSIIAFVLISVLAALEIKFSNLEEKILDTYDQKIFYILIISATIAFSMIISSVICIYNGFGRMSKLMGVFIISGFLLFHLFIALYKEINITSYQNGLMFLIEYMIVSGLLFLFSFNATDFKMTKGSSLFIMQIIYLVLFIIDVICLIVVPIVVEYKNLIGIAFVLAFLSAAAFFVFYHYFTVPTFKGDWIIFLIVFIAVYSAFCGSLIPMDLQYYSILLGILGVIFIVYGITLVWAYRNKWNFTLGNMLFAGIFSLIFAGFSAWRLFVDENKLFYAVVTDIFCLMACGSLYIYGMKKNRYQLKTISISAIVVYCILSVGILVTIFYFKFTPFLVYTVITIVIVILSVCLFMSYVFMNSKTDVLVLTNFFFPARRYYSGSIHKIPMFTTSFIVLTIACWVWGLFGMTCMPESLIPSIVITAAFVIPSLFGIALLIELDMKCLYSLQYVSTDTMTHAVGKAMHAAGVSSNLKTPTIDKSDYRHFVESERALNKMNSAISYFITALKAQLFISSQMAFIMAKDKLKSLLKSKGIEADFLDMTDFNPEGRMRIINLYMALTGQKSIDAPTSDRKQNLAPTVRPSAVTISSNARAATTADSKPKKEEKKKEEKKKVDNTKSNARAATTTDVKPKKEEKKKEEKKKEKKSEGGFFSKWFSKEPSSSGGSKADYSPPWIHITEYMRSKDTIRKQIDGVPNNSTSKYMDNGFHPTKKIEETDNRLLQGCTWERAEVLYSKQKFIDTCQPNDIVQGYFGDCYVVTAMSSICKSITKIKDLFYRPEIAVKNGLACVNFKAMNMIISVNVDTQIPMLNNKPRMTHPATERSPYWFVIVEKAFAKLIGSYSDATGGTPDEALYRMLGGYPINLNLNDLDVREQVMSGELFNMMCEWQRKGSHLIAGSPEGSHFKKNKEGIVQGHAYNILEVVEYRGVQLLKLRNPWGEQEWNGDWSSNSNMWKKYPAVASRCKFDPNKSQTDGVFWMSFKDFTANYAYLYCVIPSESLPRYKYLIFNSMQPGQNDGAKPVTDCAEADVLPQYIMRVSSAATVKFFFERTGPSVGTWIYCVKGKEPIKKIFSGTKYKSEPIPANSAIYSYTWELDSGEWTLVVCRNKCDQISDFALKVYSDVRIEISPLINCNASSITTSMVY